MAMANKGNIVLFPFMAHGHLNPFMALARQLDKRQDYTITIVNTPKNIKKLKLSLPSETNICFAEIPFCSTNYGLPPDTENTDTLSYQQITCFLEAAQDFESPFKKLLQDMTRREGRPPLCIISDMFLGWTVNVAKELGIFHAVFVAGAGYSMAVFFSLSLNILECNTDQQDFSLPDFPEAPRVHHTQIGVDNKRTDGTDSWFHFKVRNFSFCLRSDSILLNTIEGLEEIGAKYFRRKMGGNKPVWMVGPACNSIVKNKKQNTPQDPDYTLSEWLNLQPPASVLYVSFGSQNSISHSQTMELAMGLEASGVAFIWVVRPPIGLAMAQELRPEWFPDGFQERIRRKNRGLLVHHWAPQLEILAHRSTGAFLSHCGWNSVLESLCEGVPIIGWPLAGEQFFNSQLLENDDVGVGVEAARGVDSADTDGDRIARVIKMVMGDTEKGKEMRRRAEKMKEKMRDAIREEDGFKGTSVRALDEFLYTASMAGNFN